MLTTIFPILDPITITPDLADKLRALADDCDRLRQRGSISALMLQAAPRLDDWIVLKTSLGLQLMGNVAGHPRLGDRRIITSPVWFADPDNAWVRTLSRFYRLGPPLDIDERRSAASKLRSESTARDRDEGSSEDRS